jgi:hypothetical protein
MIGNRDWIIAVECRENLVVLRSTGQRFPLTSAAEQQGLEATLGPLVSSMVARRQATVRAGETPYRP